MLSYFEKLLSGRELEFYFLEKIYVSAANLKTLTLLESDLLIKERLTLPKKGENIVRWTVQRFPVICALPSLFQGQKMRTHSSLSFKQVGHRDRSLIQVKSESESN